jgi:hypothetical protein
VANPGEGVVGRVRPPAGGGFYGASSGYGWPAVEAGGAMPRGAYTCIFPPSAATP